MFMKRFFLGSVLCMLGCTLSLAQADNDSSPFYVAAGIGHVSVDRGSLSLGAGNNGGISGTGTAVTLSSGYEINDYFAAELGYHDYGSPTAFSQAGGLTQACPQNFPCPHVNGFSAELLGHYELVPDLDGELRVGALDWHVGSPGNAFLQNTSGAAFIYGLGIRRRLDYGLSLLITYERSTLTTEETRIGISYSF
jgi:hypothetical protein